MKKNIIIFYFIGLFLYFLNSLEFDISKVSFIGINIKTSNIKIESKTEENQRYNVAYSSFLPEGGIYYIVDKITGVEAIIQIGYSVIEDSPYKIFLPDRIFNFFASKYDKPVDNISLSLKFLGWNRDNEESIFLDVQSLIVEPEKSLDGIKKNGDDKFYIQIGSFSFYQNALPKITDLLSMLELRPKFYLIKKEIIVNGEKKNVYRVLAGPYTESMAKEISERINSKKEKSVIIQKAKNILKE
ncbi:MAG TPA: SPOR domain-containing protein [Spirochaetota bacterium]|nr:SPOR domain-containing protein [Spirochaetota bacterium]HOL56525.1 SPOR domain-containing protein [Spirochaetota bacterium]HPP03949.1 SPOR domain-containing protein [Spirochaetota bacterium]